MDTTASSFTLRKNAKRAAEAMIRKGIAPAADYGIKLSDDGRFEIVWKITTSAPTTDEVETEIARASAAQPAAALPTGAASQSAPAATESATTDAAPQPAPAAEAASQPAPVATEAAPALSEPAPNEWPHGTRVMVRKRKSWREATIVSRLDPDHWRVPISRPQPDCLNPPNGKAGSPKLCVLIHTVPALTRRASLWAMPRSRVQMLAASP